MLTALFFATYIALVLVSLPCWRNAMVKFRRGEPVLQPRKRIASPFGLIDVAIMFFTWLFGQFGSVSVAVVLLGIQPDAIADLSSTKLAVLTCIVAVGQIVSTGTGMLLIFIRYQRWDIFGIQPENFTKDVLIGLQAFLMVVPPVLLLQWSLTFVVKYEHSTLEMLAEDQSWLTIGATWFAAVLVASFCEEIFFRGVLQSWLQRLGFVGNSSLERSISGGWPDQDHPGQLDLLAPSRRPDEDPSKTPGVETHPFENNLAHSNPYQAPVAVATHPQQFGQYVFFDSSAIWMPIFVSAAVFALAHVGQGAAPIPLFVFGLALGYLYRQTGSIMPCIVLHLGLNGYSMFWFTLQILFPEVEV